MGVPIAIKEIFSIKGLPYGAGTDLDLNEITPPQGPFIQKLKRAGCVILGTTRTTEFAAATINVKKPMPWNPADEHIKRVCGGSSHGSAAALRAGLCAFSVGSDTGGSVRLPAALCGVFGFKSTAGVWPTEGVFCLSPTLDSVGVFTRSADDAALIFSALGNGVVAEVPRAGRSGLESRKHTSSINSTTPYAARSRRRLRSCKAKASRLSTWRFPMSTLQWRCSEKCFSRNLSLPWEKSVCRQDSRPSTRCHGPAFRQALALKPKHLWPRNAHNEAP